MDTRRRTARLYLSGDKSLREVAQDVDSAIDTLHRRVKLQRNEHVGCVVVFQPPYSPECNALEKLRSQRMAHIRGLGAQERQMSTRSS